MTDLVGAVLTRPVLDAAQAQGLLERAWGIDGALRALPSERDVNFAVRVDGLDAYVLKVANRDEDESFLAMQHAEMALLAEAGVPCQRPVPSVGGETVLRWSPAESGEPLLVRLLTWLPGRPLSAIPPSSRSDALLEDLGATMGRSARALDGFDHPAARRTFQWDPRRGLEVISAHAAAVTDTGRAALLARWRDRLAPLDGTMASLHHGVIHNDANDNNVLVADDEGSISGLLDFGDSVFTIVVNELAVAAAYAALDTTDPIDVIDAVRRGFERELPLTAAEAAALLDLVALRLCTSVALSAHQSRLVPGDAYLTVSERPAWELLATLERERGG